MFLVWFVFCIPVSTTQCTLQHKLTTAIDYWRSQVQIQELTKGLETVTKAGMYSSLILHMYSKAQVGV